MDVYIGPSSVRKPHSGRLTSQRPRQLTFQTFRQLSQHYFCSMYFLYVQANVNQEFTVLTKNKSK